MRALALIALLLPALLACPADKPVDPAPKPEKPGEKDEPDKPLDTPSTPGDEQGHQLVDADANSPFRDVEARALQLFALGRLDEAVALVAPFGEDAKNSGAQRLLAMIYLRQGDAAKAGPHVKRYSAHPAAQKSISEVFERRMKQLEAGGKGSFNHAPFDAVLKEVVKERAVDYAALEAKRGDLEAYLKAVSTADAAALSPDEKLAFYTNAYNGWVLMGVMKAKLVDDKRTVQQAPGFFDGQKYPVGGQQMTLNELEEKKLRPPHGPAEVHFVVNCASLSCPPLADTAYTGENWKKMLDAQTKAYVKRDVTVDAKKKELAVVEIFKWYEKDFGGKEGVRKFLAKHGVTQATDPAWTVVTKPYDWRLNAAK